MRARRRIQPRKQMAGPRAPGAEIKGLHHTAYRCRDAAETRAFYEDFLGLPLVDAFEIKQTITNATTQVRHPAPILERFRLAAQLFQTALNRTELI